MVATEMMLETYTRGKRTTLRLRLSDLDEAVGAQKDLEAIPLDLTVDEVDIERHGSQTTTPR